MSAEIERDDDLLSVAEVAAKLRKSPRFVHDLLRANKLRGSKYGGEWHVERGDLKAFIKSRANVPAVRR